MEKIIRDVFIQVVNKTCHFSEFCDTCGICQHFQILNKGNLLGVFFSPQIVTFVHNFVFFLTMKAPQIL